MSADIKRICLWSGPRNISTALMYSFAQREDTSVVDEPLYAHYLSNSNAAAYHPGAEEVMGVQENDGQKVIDDVILGEYDTSVAFFKQMTHHLAALDWSFLKQTTNIILTRDPEDMLPSYAQKVNEPSLRDVGYAQHLELLHYLRDEAEQDPAVIDSKNILKDPEKILGKLCEHLDIPFDEAMLSWKAGPRPEDGIWAKHWYHSVHQSTKFQPYRPKTEPFPGHLEPLLQECGEYYRELKKYSI